MMADSAGFAMHRPELSESLAQGEEKIKSLPHVLVDLGANQVLIQAGERHDFVYRLRSGWLARSRTSEDGRQQIILVFLPGDLFAVMSMFLSSHPDRIVTLEPCVVERFHEAVLHEALNNDRNIADRCIWQVLEEERRLHSWVFGLGQGSAEERLALLLTDFRGRLVTSGTVAPDALSFAMPLTQNQIADHLGITSVHVNRVVKQLREQQIATIRGGIVTLHSMERLKQLASPLLDSHERRSSAYAQQGTE